MRVAILTQPLGQNYGGLLQAYALQTYLKRIGCEVETLDRRTPNTGRNLAKGYLLNIARLVLGRIKSIPTGRKQAYIFAELSAFRDRYITMSPTVADEREIRDYYRKQQFNAFLVGSDQVWRPRYSPSILNFYLDFLNDITNSAKRIAYAASFGVDVWEYSSDLTETCKNLALRFTAVSVRERSAVNLCNDKLGVSAEWVVDPTLLLDPADYEPIIDECGENIHAHCVLSYVLDPAPWTRSVADTVGNLLGTNVYSIKPELSVVEVRTEELGKCRFPSVECWLQAFRDASFIVTDSFHGTVFSILFNKPFIAIGNSARGLARFESLLSQFGLGERLVRSESEVTLELIQREINWDNVNTKRKSLAEKSQMFLKVHLAEN